MKRRFGPYPLAAPPTAPLFRKLLWLVFILPLAGLWVNDQFNPVNVIVVCWVVGTLYSIFPHMVALNKPRYEAEYMKYLGEILAQLRQPGITKKERSFLYAQMSKLKRQYHVVLDPQPALDTAEFLAKHLEEATIVAARIAFDSQFAMNTKG